MPSRRSWPLIGRGRSTPASRPTTSRPAASSRSAASVSSRLNETSLKRARRDRGTRAATRRARFRGIDLITEFSSRRSPVTSKSSVCWTRWPFLLDGTGMNDVAPRNGLGAGGCGPRAHQQLRKLKRTASPHPSPEPSLAVGGGDRSTAPLLAGGDRWTNAGKGNANSWAVHPELRRAVRLASATNVCNARRTLAAHCIAALPRRCDLERATPHARGPPLWRGGGQDRASAGNAERAFAGTFRVDGRDRVR
jgi:hypothetical protein